MNFHWFVRHFHQSERSHHPARDAKEFWWQPRLIFFRLYLEQLEQRIVLNAPNANELTALQNATSEVNTFASSLDNCPLNQILPIITESSSTASSTLSQLPLLDAFDVCLEETTAGVVFYTAVLKQPPTAQPASVNLQLYLDSQPHERKVQQLVLPALVLPGPDGKDLLLSQNPGVYIEAPVTLPPGQHRIAVHGGAFQNAQKNAAVIISQRKLSFLPLSAAKA
jgi:hypothetical protein